MTDLLPGERVIEKAYISRVAKVYYYIAGAALVTLAVSVNMGSVKLPLEISLFYITIILVLAGFGLVAISELRRLYHKYIITNKRVIKESGILKSEVTAWELRQIINVRVYQSLLGRLTGFGTVDVVLTGNNNLFLESVRHPEKLMGILEELVEEKTSEVKLTK